MASNDYHFITRWTMDAPISDVYGLISHPLDYPRWWPEVYLAVTEIEKGNDDGLGRLVELHTKGRLPYTLRWRARTIEVNKPVRIAIEATGDFVGRGIWTLAPMAPAGPTTVEFDWRLRADKPMLKRLSFLLKPVFSANHRWAMARGEENLRRELAIRASALRSSGSARGMSA